MRIWHFSNNPVVHEKGFGKLGEPSAQAHFLTSDEYSRRTQKHTPPIEGSQFPHSRRPRISGGRALDTRLELRTRRSMGLLLIHERQGCETLLSHGHDHVASMRVEAEREREMCARYLVTTSSPKINMHNPFLLEKVPVQRGKRNQPPVHKH